MHPPVPRPARCLITGASGFIGARLCERFDAIGTQKFIPTARSPQSAAAMRQRWPQVAVANLLDQPRLERALDGCDAIVHLAHGDRAVDATRHLVDSAIRQKIGRFVHISTMSVHGPRPGAEAAREETARIGRYDHDYSDSKAEQEEIVQAAHDRGDLPAVILRPTIVYGPGSHFVQQIVAQSRDGEVTWFDQGKGICNVVYVDDVCDAIDAALVSRDALGQAMFINGDEEISWQTFIEAFAGMHQPPPRFSNLSSSEALAYWAANPPVTARSLAGRIVQKLKRLAGMGPVPAPWPPLGRVQRETFPIFFENDRAKRLLNWSPRIDFEHGVALTRASIERAGAVR